MNHSPDSIMEFSFAYLKVGHSLAEGERRAEREVACSFFAGVSNVTTSLSTNLHSTSPIILSHSILQS